MAKAVRIVPVLQKEQEEPLNLQTEFHGCPYEESMPTTKPALVETTTEKVVKTSTPFVTSTTAPAFSETTPKAHVETTITSIVTTSPIGEEIPTAPSSGKTTVVTTEKEEVLTTVESVTTTPSTSAASTDICEKEKFMLTQFKGTAKFLHRTIKY